METAHWPQGIGVVKSGDSKPNAAAEKKPRPQKEQALNCPRCNSTNTKFCYYNNYSLSQPRYFCKTCRRYWTEGGSLRNVPVGGGSRKNKRGAAAAAPPQSKKFLSDNNPQNFSPQNPRIQETHDLNLTYDPSHYNAMSDFAALHQNLSSHHPSSDAAHRHHNLPLMELLKSGGGGGGGLSSFMSVPISDAVAGFSSSGLPAPDFFGNETNQSSRILFPFEEVKPVSNNDHFEEERVQGETNVYWNGMLAGGSW